MGWDAPSHWLIVAVVLALLFGYKKLPDAARSVGRSLRIFKTEIKGMGEDDKAREAAKADVTPPVPPAIEPAPPAATGPVDGPSAAGNTEKPASSTQ
jgi:sec-independent protein translocase protein TatA